MLDENDNEPSFSRTLYPPPHILSVQEEQTPGPAAAALVQGEGVGGATAGGVVVGNVALAEDKDTGVNSQICYYLVGECVNIDDNETLIYRNTEKGVNNVYLVE